MKLNKTKLELILIKFANAVLDSKNGVTNPTLGELIDTPSKAIQELAGENEAE